MGSQRSRGKKGNAIGLHMECYEDELSPAQVAAYSKVKNEFTEFTAKIESLIKNNNVNVTEKNEGLVVLQVNSNAPPPPPLTGLAVNSAATQVPPGPTPISLTAATILPPATATPITLQTTQPQSPNLVAHTAGASVGTVPQGSPTAYQLVMDPRGFIVGTVAPQASTSLTVPVMAAPVMQQTTTQPAPTSTQTVAPNNKVALWRSSAKTPAPQTTVAGNAVGGTSFHIATKAVVPAPASVRVTQPSAINKAVPAAAKVHTPVITSNTTNRQKSTPNAANSAASATIVDLTDDDCKASGDNREVTFNKLSGKTYPSLVVVARSHLRIKEMSQAQISQERTYLDTKVKGVLMYSPTKFTEWLIQQGLLRSDQYCSVHVNSENNPVKLKLGMYSDISKFPYSGGYVWISDCCPQKFVSVFSGSIFEGALHAPTVLLKLMYHWSCQTNVQNIIQWVKVENPNIKNFYTTMRAVCTAAVHENCDKLGGPKKKVEVGVISLGTTSQDGNIRRVKVEVLGLMEHDTKLLRLHAVEPVPDGEHHYKRRFARILAPLDRWVHKDSIILTDMTVDKGTLHQMGYTKVYQVAANSENSRMKEYTNSDIMDYLRRIVPRMFQNTLSLLSRQIIQQFLDELVWRERWGPIASQAFDTLITHIADQTKLQTGDTLVARLSKVAANPFKDWSYANWKTNCMPTSVMANPVVNKRQLVTPRAAVLDMVQKANAVTTTTPALSSTTTVTTTTGGQRNKRQATSPPGTVSEPEAKKAATSNTGAAQTLASPVVFSSCQELIALEPYYYGSLQGNKEILEKPKYGPLNMKCCVCTAEIRDNLTMMKHLIGHAGNEVSYSTGDTAPRCRYCLQNFATETAVNNHVEEVHLKTTSLTCLICEEKFRSRMNLISHMQLVHEELELPYVCGICRFRTSQHTVLIDHFYEEHHESERGQCPFCLKVLMFESNNRRLTNGLYYYINHIQRHQLKTVTRKCLKCKLSFVNKESFRDHQKDHNSCRDVPGVKRYPSAGFDSVMMPKPQPKPGASNSKGGQTKTFKASSNKDFIISNFDTLHVSDIGESALCMECKGPFTESDHFVGYHYCLNCRFATCCNKAMFQHKTTFHDKYATPTFDLSKPVVLEKYLHCVCGFKSNSGNKLAKHLAVCHRKSAYPSAERASQCTLQCQSASFPPLVTLDEPESEDKLIRAYIQHNELQESTKKESKPAVESGVDPPSMLNILGLVRKASTEDSNQDKPSSSDEVLVASENSSVAERAAEKQTEQLAEKSAEQPVEKSAEKPIGTPAEKLIVKPAEKLVVKLAEKLIVKPTEKLIVKPAEKLIVKPAEKLIVKPAEKLIEQPVKIAVEQPPVEKAYPPEQTADKENEVATDAPSETVQEPQDDNNAKMDCDDDVVKKSDDRVAMGDTVELMAID